MSDALPKGKNPKITNSPDSMSIDVKRFYVPAVITAQCPFCGKECENDYSDEYFSYPDTNERFGAHFYCDGPEGKDDHEFEVDVVLRITLEVAP